MMKKILALGLLLLSGLAHAQVYNIFSPGPVGPVKSNGSYALQAMSATDIAGLWDVSCTATQALLFNGTCVTVGPGTVISVGLTAPSVFSVAGSPVTGVGTLAVTFAGGQTQNQVLASPNGSSGALSLRSLVLADLPAGVGTVTSVSAAGTGIYSWTGSPITGSGTLTLVATGTSGGIPYFSAGTTLSSSGVLTANRLVLGGGAGVAPTILGSLGTTTTLLHGNAAGAPTFGAVSLTADVSGNLPVTNLNSGTAASSTTFWRGDGTWATTGTVSSVAASANGIFSWTGSPITTTGTLGLVSTGTSGGIPYFSAGTTLSTSAALTQNALLLGGGAGGAPTNLGSLGTTTTLLHGNAAGAPTFAAVALAADVSGNLPVTNLNSGTSASATTFWRGDGTWATPAGGGGTPGGSTTQVQYNNAGAFGGSAAFTWDDGTHTLTLGNAATAPTFKAIDVASGTAPLLSIAGSTNAAGAGGGITGTAGAGTTSGGLFRGLGGAASASNGVGGGIQFTGGLGGNGTGVGGAVVINGGTGAIGTGTGGDATLAAGGGGTTAGNGGALNVNAGDSIGSTGGATTLRGGNGPTAGILTAAGGGGTSAASVGAVATFRGGTGGTSGNGGAANFKGGDSGVTSGTGGAVAVQAGTSAAGTGATTNVQGGTTGSGTGGQLTLNGGSAGGSNQSGGAVTLAGGARTGTGNVGMVNLGSGYQSTGTKFTTTGSTCTTSATAGGATAGTVTLSSNTCNLVLVFNGASGALAGTGWHCDAHNRVAAPLYLGEQSSTTTTATIPIPAGVGTTDVVSFSCIAFQ